MNRRKSILLLLIYSDGKTTISKIANELNVSERTIRNELSYLEKIAKTYNVKIVREPGKGTSVEGDSKCIKKLLNHFKDENDMKGESPAERQKKILLALFASNVPVMIKELRIDLYVSRTTITKDIKVINDWISEFNLEIKYFKSEGLIIEGKESDKRKLLSKLLSEQSVEDIFHNLNAKDKNTEKFLSDFRDMINIDIEKLRDIIFESEAELGYKFSTESFVNLIIHIAIAVDRARSGNEITLTTELLEALNKNIEYKVAENAAKKIEKSFDIILPDSEVYYILLHFLGAKTMNNEGINLGFKLESKEYVLDEVINELIRKVGEELNIFLESDIQLYNSILLHLKPTINRIKYKLNLTNPLIEEIKKNYLEVFIAISEHIGIINDAFKINLPEDEIGYLVLHFAASIERNLKGIRALVVCASGIGMSQLIVARIQRLFKNIEVIAATSVLDIDSYNYEDIDLIISTVNIKSNKGIKTVVVNPLLNEYDIKNIRDSIKEDRVHNNLFFNMFSEKNIYLNMDFGNKEELLHFISSELIKNDSVSTNYINSLIERENFGSTYIGNGVAVVHGAKNEVINSCLQIISMKNPIKWNKSDEVIFIINAVCGEEDSRMFSSLFTRIGMRLDDEKFWNKIKNTDNKKVLIELLDKEINYDNR